MDVWRTRGANAGKLRYLTVAARIFTGQAAHELDRMKTFDATAWYNYVQAMMHGTTKTDFRRNPDGSARAFREVLANLDPTHIIETGSGNLWKNLPSSDGPTGEIGRAHV